MNFRLVLGAAALFLCLPQIVTETTALTSFAANIAFEHNFHAVVPGRFYRAAEIPPAELGDVLRSHGIRTVIDLRRGDAGSAAEAAAVRQAGASYLHIPLNSGRPAGRARLQALLDAYLRAEPPVLVHCTSGTHRSGFAAAVWLLDQENAPFSIAAAQLAPRFGFFRLERRLKSLLTGYPTIDEVLWRYGEAAPAGFRSWVDQNVHQ